MATADPIVEVAADHALADRVPDAIAKDGVLRIGTDPPYKPMEFYNAQQQLTGLEVQLAMAIARKLDLEPRFTPEAFTAVEAGVRADRFELGAAALTLPPGEQLSTDAVLYLASGIRLGRQQGSNVELATMCGRRVSALEGSQQLTALSDASKRCTAAGAAPIVITAFPTQDDVTRSVLTGRAAAMVADAPVVQSAVHTYPSEIEMAPGEIDPAPFALLTSAQGEFADVVAAAIDELIADGSYDRILGAFGIREGAVARAVVLPAGEPAPKDPLTVPPPDGS